MSLYQELKENYALSITQEEINKFVDSLTTKQSEAYNDLGIQQTIFSCIDLTTLKQADSRASVKRFVEKVNQFSEDYPNYPNVGGTCVYPNFAPIVKETLKVDSVRRAVVAGGFPSSQTFIEIKAAEAKMAVRTGANEVDIVIPVGETLENTLEEMFIQVKAIKSIIEPIHLKVILETGVLESIDKIWYASIAAMLAGADFIKTSTGKETQGDMLSAAYVMCCAIKRYKQETNRMVGFKPAGGIRTAYDATMFYLLVDKILGNEWLNANYFRIGASSLANSSLSRMETLRTGQEREIKYF